MLLFAAFVQLHQAKIKKDNPALGNCVTWCEWGTGPSKYDKNDPECLNKCCHDFGIPKKDCKKEHRSFNPKLVPPPPRESLEDQEGDF